MGNIHGRHKHHQHPQARAAIAEAETDPDALRRKGVCDDLAAASALACKVLRDNADVGEANLFFVPCLGAGVEAAAQRVARVGKFTLAQPSPAYAQVHRRLGELHDEAESLMWTDPNQAVRALWARQEENLLMYLPGPAAPGHKSGATRVGVYTQSPIEDLYVNLPLLLSGKCDAQMIALLRASMDARCYALGRRLSMNCSIWVYLRMTNACWDARLLELSANCTKQELEAMVRHRAALDAFFESDPFTRKSHTVVVDVSASDMDQDVVAWEVAQLLSEYVMAQFYAEQWSLDVLPAHLAEHISKPHYQRHRTLKALTPTLVAPPQRSATVASAAVAVQLLARQPSSGGTSESGVQSAGRSRTGSAIGLRAVNPEGATTSPSAVALARTSTPPPQASKHNLLSRSVSQSSSALISSYSVHTTATTTPSRGSQLAEFRHRSMPPGTNLSVYGLPMPEPSTRDD